jgi:hypothetical protein
MSGNAFADGETLVLAPLAGFGLAAGAIAGYVAGYNRGTPAVFAGSVAAYVLLSWLAAMLWADSIGAFMFSAAYTMLVGMLVFTAGYFLLHRLGRRLRRRRRGRNAARRL